MKTTLKLIKIGNSNGLIIPRAYCEHINIEAGEDIIIQDDKGKYGNFISFWKKGE